MRPKEVFAYGNIICLMGGYLGNLHCTQVRMYVKIIHCNSGVIGISANTNTRHGWNIMTPCFLFSPFSL